jgi:hypothetical protein
MIKRIPLKYLPKYFCCPSCLTTIISKLKVIKNGLHCSQCKNNYRIKNGILEFVIYNDLNKETRRELKGNSFALTKSNIKHYASKDTWSSYYYHFVNQKFTYLISYLNTFRFKGLISLGSGPGFEIKEILKRKPIKTIFSSDLAFSATSVVPETLKDYDIDLCLFTSDLNKTPVLPNTSYPILIYEALHHTGDMHLSIEKLLQKGYKNILFVEPSTNFLINILAKYGRAQRVEYSGLKPEFLNIGTLKKLSKKYNYALKIHTIWDIPEDYFRIICKNKSTLQSIILRFIDLISYVTNFFQFGSFAIVSLEQIR